MHEKEKPVKWVLQLKNTQAENPETIASCIAPNKIAAIQTFASRKGLTPEQLLNIFNVCKK